MNDTRTVREKQILVLERVAEELVKLLKTTVPPTGYFRPSGFRFEIIGSKHNGLMRVEFKEGALRFLHLGVIQADSDRLFSHFLPSGTNAELIGYLEEPASMEQWLDSVTHLTQKADRYE